MPDLSPSQFPNLEPNHRVHTESIPTGETLIIVTCPGINAETKGLTSSWSDDEPDEHINCLFCDFLKGEWVDHGCQDSGDREQVTKQ